MTQPMPLGHEDAPRRRRGRPRRDLPLQQVLDAYQKTHSVRAAAKLVAAPPGTVWHRLKDTGVLQGRA